MTHHADASPEARPPSDCTRRLPRPGARSDVVSQSCRSCRTRVEADDQRRLADPVLQMVDVERPGVAGGIPRTPPSSESSATAALSARAAPARAASERRSRSRRRAAAARTAWSPLRTGVHGPRPSAQPVISGCLSRWAVEITVSSAPAVGAGTSIYISGSGLSAHDFERRALQRRQLPARPTSPSA